MGYQFYFTLITLLCLSSYVTAQDFSLQVKPDNPELMAGDSLQLEVTVLNKKGKPAKGEHEIYFFSRARKIASVDRSTGMLRALQGGEANIIVMMRDPNNKTRIREDITVNIQFPAIKEIAFSQMPEQVYIGTSMPIQITATDDRNQVRKDVAFTLSSSSSELATLDINNYLYAKEAGELTLTAEVEGITHSQKLSIVPNPVKELELLLPMSEVRTGDVVSFQVKAMDENGNEINNVPVIYAYQGKATSPSYSAAGYIDQEGDFVGYEPGFYTVTASCGYISASQTLKVGPRDIQQRIQFVGRGAVNDVHTSDLWVWEGVDGKDYCVTGTWGANGEAYFWDVTDPANIVPTDTFTVDARTVNDVKVSEDGKVCVISREGASNRKNGIVILDVTNPRDVKLHSVFDKGLTGGVHNLFIYQNHVYALSNGERYDIINIEDPTQPKKVGTFELDTPGHSIHDVWIEDGIAYSSNWSDGVQLVDIGNGIKGGTPSNPKKVGSYAYPSGWNHAAFPYKSPTGKFYVIAGDEAFPNGLFVNEKPTYAGGYLHVIDFTDIENPKEVAHYEVPGAGSHNFWVQNDTLYVANYNAGLRVVDISGELKGDLFRQGREIGWYKPTDNQGRIPNAPMTWGPQPHKGHIFFSDWNSGLWSVKLPPKPQPKQIQ